MVSNTHKTSVTHCRNSLTANRWNYNIATICWIFRVRPLYIPKTTLLSDFWPTIFLCWCCYCKFRQLAKQRLCFFVFLQSHIIIRFVVDLLFFAKYFPSILFVTLSHIIKNVLQSAAEILPLGHDCAVPDGPSVPWGFKATLGLLHNIIIIFASTFLVLFVLLPSVP